MITEFDIKIDGVEMPCLVDFDYFIEDGEVTINFNSICALQSKLDVFELVSEDDLNELMVRCQRNYEWNEFHYWEQRYEEKNSGLARD